MEGFQELGTDGRNFENARRAEPSGHWRVGWEWGDLDGGEGHEYKCNALSLHLQSSELSINVGFY